MGRISIGILLLLGLSIPAPLLAEIYKWIDEQGVIHFTDDYTKIPEKYRKKKLKVIEETPLPPPAQQPTISSSGEGPKTSAEQTKEERRERGDIRIDNEGHDRAWWQAQIATWKQKRDQAIAQRKELEARYEVLVRRAYNPAFGQRGRRSLQGELKAVEDRLTQLQLAIDEANEMLEKKLPAQAAEAGAPSEWLQ